MQITFTPVYGISGMTGQPTDLLLSVSVAISDAPVLTGTPKQIAYANDIRDAAICDACKSAIDRARLADGGWLKTSRGGQQALDTIATLNQQIAPVAAKLATYTTAKDWIEAAKGSKSQLTVRALINK